MTYLRDDRSHVRDFGDDERSLLPDTLDKELAA